MITKEVRENIKKSINADIKNSLIKENATKEDIKKGILFNEEMGELIIEITEEISLKLVEHKNFIKSSPMVCKMILQSYIDGLIETLGENLTFIYHLEDKNLH